MSPRACIGRFVAGFADSAPYSMIVLEELVLPFSSGRRSGIARLAVTMVGARALTPGGGMP